MKKVVQFLSASDRLNYGDLLFPIITKEVLSSKSDIDFKNYALIKSNLTHFGALPTRSYRRLEKENTSSSIIVIGGGHVLFPHWSTLYGHINRFYLKTKKLNIVNWLYRHLNFPRRLFTKSKIGSPYAPYHLKGTLVYLSVGGNIGSMQHDQRIAPMLQNTGFFSVRDTMLYQQCVQKNIDAYLVPDTAIIMSNLFPEHELSEKLSSNFSFNIKKKYVIVQIGLHKGPEQQKKFVSDINCFKAKGYQILCMPIGLAADHEDDKVLLRLMEHDKDWQYYCPNNVYEIMYLIHNANWFFGTSLHGCITAFAYQTPFTPLNKKVKKLNNYTKTWWSSFIKESVDYNDLESYLEKESEQWNYKAASNALLAQQNEVMKNYQRLLALLSNKSE